MSALLPPDARSELTRLTPQGSPTLSRGIEGGLHVLNLQQPLQDRPVLLARRLRRRKLRLAAGRHAHRGHPSGPDSGPSDEVARA